MDANVKLTNKKKIERTIKALEKNNMNGYYIESHEDLINKIKEIVKEGSKVSFGGSMTLTEAGVMELLRNGKYNLLDRSKAKSPEEVKNIYRETFFCDAFFCSSNAVTEEGELYNVDGTGNRTAAMIYGPDKVIVICGVNKIVADVNEAVSRKRHIAATANAIRLSRKTPCANTGVCSDCSSPERICNDYVLIKKQADKNRIHVLFLNEDLGY